MLLLSLFYPADAVTICRESIPGVIAKGRLAQVPKMQHDTVNSGGLPTALNAEV